MGNAEEAAQRAKVLVTFRLDEPLARGVDRARATTACAPTRCAGWWLRD
jgi:hypothetical protein